MDRPEQESLRDRPHGRSGRSAEEEDEGDQKEDDGDQPEQAKGWIVHEIGSQRRLTAPIAALVGEHRQALILARRDVARVVVQRAHSAQIDFVHANHAISDAEVPPGAGVVIDHRRIPTRLVALQGDVDGPRRMQDRSHL
jgi:hypothetical protein